MKRKLLTALNPVSYKLTLYATYSTSINLMVIWLLHVPIRPLFSLETFEKEEWKEEKEPIEAEWEEENLTELYFPSKI